MLLRFKNLAFLLLFLTPVLICAQQPVQKKVSGFRPAFADPASSKNLDSLRIRSEQLSRHHILPPSTSFADKPSKKPPSTPPGSMGKIKQVSNPPANLQGARTNAICYTISGRDFLRQDSLLLWPGYPSTLADGNVIVSGEFANYSTTAFSSGAFCMKTDIAGNVIWAKLYDSTNQKGAYDYMNHFKSLALKNGNILLYGRTSNFISGNDDVELTLLDKNGNIIWLKTYASKLWQGFNGSGDFFPLKDVKEDPATGDIYFVGSHWIGTVTVTKLSSIDGHIIWSRGYGSDKTFGIVIEADKLLLFQLLTGGPNNDNYIGTTAIDKIAGDTLYSKFIRQTGDRYAARLHNTYEVIKLNNGHYRMSGPTSNFFEYPTYTGTVDLYHAGIVELDENLDFVSAWGFKSRLESNGYNTMISLFPDGTGMFTSLGLINGYNSETQICLFRDDLIYHQRKRIHVNEGVAEEPPSLQLADGGFLDIRYLGENTPPGTEGSRIEYYRIHTADTPSTCLGVLDSANAVWHFNFEPLPNLGFNPLTKDVFSVSREKKYDVWDFGTSLTPACVVVSHCDTLKMEISATNICPGANVTLTIHKNKGCGSLVPLQYDSNFVSNISKLNDSTYNLLFNKAGSSYIQGSLMGCQLKKDSVLINVLPAMSALNLGPDTVLCPGNLITLNARKGFATYTWQDGSTDSTYKVTAAGKYYVTAANACGTTYSDTLEVRDHPPIPFSVGQDRVKCNQDTIQLNATAGFIKYNWSPNYNISALTNQEVIVNPLKDTLYTVSAEKTPGCFAYDTIFISVKTSPKINLGKDTSICAMDSIVLDAGAGFDNYRWSTGAVQQSVKIQQPGLYSVNAVTVDGCTSADTFRIVTVNNLPQPYLGPDSVICKDQARILSPRSQYNSYNWNNGSTGKSISILNAGVFWVSVIDANGCKGSDTTVVTEIMNVAAGFLGGDTAVCTYQKIELFTSGSFSQYNWSTGSIGKTLIVTKPGIYWLEAVDINNCKAHDTIVVTQKDCMEGLYVPNAFTPNGDGQNEIFRPLLFGNIASFNFQVFNRWGQMVFQTKTPGEGWDGQHTGRPQDGNTFIWVCVYELAGKSKVTEKGTVVMIK